MIAMPFHPSNTYTIDELKANLDDILADVEKKAQISLDGKVPYTLRDKVIDGKLYSAVPVSAAVTENQRTIKLHQLGAKNASAEKRPLF